MIEIGYKIGVEVDRVTGTEVDTSSKAKFNGFLIPTAQ